MRLPVFAPIVLGLLAATVYACSSDDTPGAGTNNDAGAPDSSSGGFPDAGPAADAAPGDDDTDANVDASTGPVVEHIIDTTDTVVDIGVLNQTVYFLLASPSRIETCSATACTTRTALASGTQMPAEVAKPKISNENQVYYSNAQLAVTALGGQPAVVVLQSGNAGNPNGSAAGDIIEHPGIYAIGAQAPALIQKMTTAGFFKSSNGATPLDSRGNWIWYAGDNSNEGSPHSLISLLSLTGTPANAAVGVFRQEDVARNLGGPALPGDQLAGAHRTGSPYITAHPDNTVHHLVEVDIAAPTDGTKDTNLGIDNATFLTTTATLRFTRDATTTTTPNQFFQSSDAHPSPELVTVPGVDATTTVIGTELGLVLVSRAAADVDATGPVTVQFCSEASLVAKSCTPETIDLAGIDSVQRVKDEAPYLYVWGTKSGTNVISRFVP